MGIRLVVLVALSASVACSTASSSPPGAAKDAEPPSLLDSGRADGALKAEAASRADASTSDSGDASTEDASSRDSSIANALDGSAGINPTGLDIPPEFRAAYDDNRTAALELISSLQSTWDGSHPPVLQGVEIEPGDAINSIFAASTVSDYLTTSVDPFLSAVFGSTSLGGTVGKMLIHFPMAQIPDGTGATFWEWEASNDCANFHTGSMTCAQYFYQDTDNVTGHWCGVPNGSGGYYAPLSQCGRYIATWQAIISEIHTMYGGKVIIQSQVQPEAASGSNTTTVWNLSGFYASLSYASFNAGRAAQCAFLGNWPGSARPDYLNVLSEPDTMYEKGAPAETDPAGSNFVQNIQAQLVTILNEMNTANVPASVTRVIGMGNWEAQLSAPCQGSLEGDATPPCGILGVETGINSLVTGYPSRPGVSVLDLHMHYNNDCSLTGNPCGTDTKNYMTQALLIANAVKSAGFELGFDESWPFEYSNAQLGVAATNLSLLEANDADAFWQPFDQLWMLMLDMMAYRYSAAYVSFSEPSQYFFEASTDKMAQSLGCDPLTSCTVGQITQYVSQGVILDLSVASTELTPSGMYLKALLAHPSNYVQVDTSPPTEPTGLLGTAESGYVQLSWKGSRDNVAVADYAIYRDGSLIGHSTSTAYGDYSAQRGGSYTVVAEDANGNQGPPSNPEVVM